MNEIALRPIEIMIDKVNKIATNPLAVKSEKIIKSKKGSEEMETVLI